MIWIVRYLTQLFCRHRMRWVENTTAADAHIYGHPSGSHWQCMRCMKETWFAEPYYQDMTPGAERPRHDSGSGFLDD